MRFFLFIFLSVFFNQPAHADCTLAGTAVCDAVPCPGKAYKAGQMIYNEDQGVLQVCLADNTWRALHKAVQPIPDCPNVGDTCASNGTIYAGTYVGHKLYVTAADAPGTYTWNNGTANLLDLDNASMPNCAPYLSMPRNGNNRYSDQSIPACMGAQGEAFTAYLATFSGTASPYKAASYCYHLGKPSDPAGANNPLAHGRDDWYLPAVDELEFIYDNLGPQPNHGFQNADYWSSTESSNLYAWSQLFSGGYQDVNTKRHGSRVRCVRQ